MEGYLKLIEDVFLPYAGLWEEMVSHHNYALLSHPTDYSCMKQGQSCVYTELGTQAFIRTLFPRGKKFHIFLVKKRIYLKQEKKIF